MTRYGWQSVLEFGSSAFAVVWLVATIKDLPSADLSWPNVALASAAACLAMGCEAIRRSIDRRASQLTNGARRLGSD